MNRGAHYRCARCGRYGNPDQGACICLLDDIRRQTREGEIVQQLIWKARTRMFRNAWYMVADGLWTIWDRIRNAVMGREL